MIKEWKKGVERRQRDEGVELEEVWRKKIG